MEPIETHEAVEVWHREENLLEELNVSVDSASSNESVAATERLREET